MTVPNVGESVGATAYSTLVISRGEGDSAQRCPGLIAGRPGQRWFDRHPDGERFVVNVAQTSDTDATGDKIVLVTHFFDEELRRLMRDGTR